MDNANVEITKEPEFTFRKSVGGFKKEDVIKYISEENRKFAAEREELNGKLAEESSKAEAAAKKSSELQLYYELLLKKRSDDIAEKDAELAAAAKKAEELAAKEASFEAEKEKIRADAAKELEELKASYEAKLCALEEKCAAYEAEIKETKDALSAKAEECEKLSEGRRDLEKQLDEALSREIPQDDGLSEALKGDLASLQEKYDELTCKYEEALRAAEKAAGAAVPEAPRKAEAGFEKTSPEPARELPRQGEGYSLGAQKKAADEDAEAVPQKIKRSSADIDEISGSISRLLKEIAHRCSLLAAYIEMKADGEEVSKEIKGFRK